MVTITTNPVSKMLIFDASALPGAGELFSAKITYPFHSIQSISLFNDRVVGRDSLGVSFDLTLIPKPNMYPISKVNDVVPTSISELFNLLIEAVF